MPPKQTMDRASALLPAKDFACRALEVEEKMRELQLGNLAGRFETVPTPADILVELDKQIATSEGEIKKIKEDIRKNVELTEAGTSAVENSRQARNHYKESRDRALGTISSLLTLLEGPGGLEVEDTAETRVALKSKIASLEAQNQNLKLQLQQKQAETAQKALTATMPASSDENSQTIADLSARNADLRNQLSALQQAAFDEADKANQRISDLDEQLRDALSELESKMEDIDQKDEQLEQANHQIAEYRQFPVALATGMTNFGEGARTLKMNPDDGNSLEIVIPANSQPGSEVVIFRDGNTTCVQVGGLENAISALSLKQIGLTLFGSNINLALAVESRSEVDEYLYTTYSARVLSLITDKAVELGYLRSRSQVAR